MGRRKTLTATTVLTTLVVVLALVFLAFFLARRDERPDPSHVPPTDRPVRASEPAPVSAAATLAKTPVPARPTESGSAPSGSPPVKRALRHAILEVEVVDLAGKPVGGATVLAHGAFEGDMDLPPAPRAEGRTGADGRLEFSVPIHPTEMAWPGPILVHAFTSDAAAVSEMLDPWAPDPTHVGRARVRLELDEATTVSGRVVSYEGDAIAGADVRHRFHESAELRTTSGTDGTFRFPAVPAMFAAGWIAVSASKPGWLASGAQERAGPGRRDVVVQLGRMRGVRGRLVDPEGRPVAGESVGPDGRFSWQVPANATEIYLSPASPFVHRPAPVPKGGDIDLGDLVVERGGTIRGRIAIDEPDSRLLVGVGWRVRCHRLAMGIDVREAIADARGEFVLDGIGAGEHILRTTVGSHTPDVDVAQGEVRGVRAGDEGVRLVMYACGVLRLRPRLAGGDDVPVRGWVVEARGPHPETTVTIRKVPDRARDRSEELDGFAVGVPRPGTYAVRVKIPGYAWAEREAVQAGNFGGDPVDLVVVPERR